MIWGLVALLVVGPLLVLAAVAGQLRSRQETLQRQLAAAAAQQTAQRAALQPGQQRLQGELAALQRRAELGRRRSVALRQRMAQLRP
ncbi:hypothetical protein JQS43_13315 [Natronosporangium hydrolyticum]|uniref:Uncharacterized protein n=1 Tax=Natronosporangium hydrolyticum TaxID=2811111 RepID=A0A895YEN1_9ACTN|nr:hypothetical protein [Natronosporangium hydrolyticum]QSB12680.1 hypothetical protein JQS43_13315 [Natronosporangium hydrolyticum]